MKKLLIVLIAFTLLSVPAQSHAVVSKSVAFQAEVHADGMI